LSTHLRLTRIEAQHPIRRKFDMSERASFKPRVIEPVADNQPDGLGLAVELWLAHPVDGIAGHAVQIHLRGGARMAQAEALRDLLHQLGTDIVVA
jgi:hypothetical protein